LNAKICVFRFEFTNPLYYKKKYPAIAALNAANPFGGLGVVAEMSHGPSLSAFVFSVLEATTRASVNLSGIASSQLSVSRMQYGGGVYFTEGAQKFRG